MIPRRFEDLLRWTYRTQWRYRLLEGQHRTGLQAIRAWGTSQAQALAAVLEKTRRGRFDPVERAAVERIEALRRRCLLSPEELEHMDYGAGEPGAPTSLGDARQGIQRRTDLATLARRTSKAPPWSDLLFNLVRGLRPERSLELGTCIGFSAAYQCAAMEISDRGLLVTLEGDEGFAARAQAHLASLGLSRHRIVVGPFERTLPGVVAEDGPFDFLFNDGHHDGAAMLAYFEKTLPSLAHDAVLLFDDLDNYESMQQAWRRLARHDRVALAIDFGPMGLVCLGPARRGADVVHFPL